jgi:hypothetical protein
VETSIVARQIETYRGQLPRCRNCGKPLRPQYETQTQSILKGEEPTGTKNVYETPGEREPPENPEEEKQLAREGVFCQVLHRQVYWSKSRKTYFWVEPVYQVKSRKFRGTFGTRGNGFFCTVECGFRWAVRHLKNRPECDR